MKKNYTFSNLIRILQKYWEKQQCTILQPLDLPIGAGTFHNKTFFGAIGEEPTSLVYTQACRRPTDSRYGNNPNRLQHYYQLQVLIKPPPKNIQKMYLESLNVLNINEKNHDIRFVEDNWENPTLGACGIGWEVWLNGMEITQFTYFQQMGSLECSPTAVEITYGLERIAMHIQEKNNIYEIIWSQQENHIVTYGDLFYKNEVEQSKYNFHYANINMLFQLFEQYLAEAKKIIKTEDPLLFVAYEQVLQANHIFNLLDARKSISSSERQNYIFKIRSLIKNIAKKYFILKYKNII